jgi:NitT/TauT family transport system substrate-binding protein
MAIRHSSGAPALVALIVALGIACAPTAAPSPPAAPPSNAASAPAAATSVPAAPVAATPAGQQPPATAVRYGDLLLLADAGIFIALDEGYFAEQALSLDLVTFDSASNMVAPLATNQLDVGGGAPSAGLFNALRGGVNVRIVADKGHSDATPPGFAVSQFIVRKALIDPGQVKSVADLKGLRYGRVAPGISPELELIAWLKEGGPPAGRPGPYADELSGHDRGLRQ